MGFSRAEDSRKTRRVHPKVNVSKALAMTSPATLQVLAAVFAALFVLERFCPLRRRTAALFQRLLLNLAISALAFLTAAALVKPFGGWALHWSSERPFGLLHILALPPPIGSALGFRLMDLSFYY